MSADTGRWQIEIAIGLLAGSRCFAVLSLLLTAAAAWALAAGEASALPARAAAVVVLLGAAAAYVALRVTLDLEVFRALRRELPELGPALSSFDAALLGLGWMHETKAGRALAQRIAGVRRLTLAQGLVALAQAIILALLPGLH